MSLAEQHSAAAVQAEGHKYRNQVGSADCPAARLPQHFPAAQQADCPPDRRTDRCDAETVWLACQTAKTGRPDGACVRSLERLRKEPELLQADQDQLQRQAQVGLFEHPDLLR